MTAGSVSGRHRRSDTTPRRQYVQNEQHVIHHEFYVTCDVCDDPTGDAGTPTPAPFPTEREAVEDAVDNNGWVKTPDGRLLCHDCRGDHEPTLCPIC